MKTSTKYERKERARNTAESLRESAPELWERLERMKQTTKQILGGRVEITGPQRFVTAAAKRIESRFRVVSPVKRIARATKCSYAIQVSTAAHGKVSALDETLIGTPDYMGFAYFWSFEFRHFLRDATTSQRCRVHDLFLASGLEIGGQTDAHWEIVKRVTRKS